MADPDFKVWQCRTCGYIYEEALGLPDEGIPPGTTWDQVPPNDSMRSVSASIQYGSVSTRVPSMSQRTARGC